jgi:long-chain acyl-CoA synthetase
MPSRTAVPALALRTLCDLSKQNADRWPHRRASRWKGPEGFVQKTWSEFRTDVAVLALGLEAEGIAGAVGLFADNRYHWTVTDHALLHLGCPSVPRGSDTSPKEQKFLFHHGDARWFIVEGTKNLAALAAEFGPDDRLPDGVFLFDAPAGTAAPDADLPPGWAGRVKTYDQVRAAGARRLADEPGALDRLAARVQASDVASIIYTSGTSGNPKGVILTHANFLHNVATLTPRLHIDAEGDEIAVSVLPVWHVYERTFEFCAMNGGMALFYSCIRTLTDDLAREKPTLVASVPRVWESIYGKLQDKIAKESGVKRRIFGLFVATAKSRYKAGLALRGWRPWLEAHRWASTPPRGCF